MKDCDGVKCFWAAVRAVNSVSGADSAGQAAVVGAVVIMPEGLAAADSVGQDS